jgi:hypothetical protein
MNFQVTLSLPIENLDSLEQAKDGFLEYLSEVLRLEDLTAFNFREVSDEEFRNLLPEGCRDGKCARQPLIDREMEKFEMPQD